MQKTREGETETSAAQRVARLKCIACNRELSGIVLVCESILFFGSGIATCDGRTCGFECLHSHRIEVHGEAKRTVHVERKKKGWR